MLTSLSFRTRLTAGWTASFGLLLALTLGAVYLGAGLYARRDLDRQVRTVAATELASSTDAGLPVHLHDFPVDALGTTDFAGKFAQLYTADGRVLKQSPEIATLSFRLAPTVLDSAIRGQAPLVSDTIGSRPARIAALRVAADGEEYVLAVGLYSDRLVANLARLRNLFAGVWIVVVGFTGLLGYALASRALAPIDRMMQRAAVVARGDFAVRLDPPRHNDEIGRLTMLLNEMLDRLHGAIEANRRFAADASHELRSPLTAMAGEIDVTLKRDRTAREYRESLEVVRERLSELVTLAENLMLLTRAQEHASEALVKEVPLRALLEAPLERLQPLAQVRDIGMVADDCPDLIVYGDARLLTRVFENLLANAVQYNREGGSVRISAREEPAAPEAWATGTVVIAITDTGPGIPANEWDRVFDRFHRLDGSRSRRTGGTGLGLSICRAIVVLFQGTIRVVTSSPEGTTFEVRLPGRMDDRAAPQSGPSAMPGPPGEAMRKLAIAPGDAASG